MNASETSFQTYMINMNDKAVGMMPTIFGSSTVQNGYLVHTPPFHPILWGIIYGIWHAIELVSALSAMCEILTGMDTWHVFIN